MAVNVVEREEYVAYDRLATSFSVSVSGRLWVAYSCITGHTGVMSIYGPDHTPLVIQQGGKRIYPHSGGQYTMTTNALRPLRWPYADTCRNVVRLELGWT